MNPVLRAFLYSLVAMGVQMAENLLGPKKGKEKKKAVLAFVEESLERLAPAVGVPIADSPEHERHDFVSWLIDNLVDGANKSELFETTGPPPKEAAVKKAN
jgi:hypothetical protein